MSERLGQSDDSTEPKLHGPIDIEIHVPPTVLESVTDEYREWVDRGHTEPFEDFLTSRCWIRNETIEVDAVALDIQPADG